MKKTDTDAALQWITDCVEVAKGEPRGVAALVSDLTPAVAHVLLSLNPENRHLVAERLHQLETDLREGRWILNGESLIVSDEGTLNDGQHRCQAVLNTEISAPAVFVFGPPRPSRLTVDQGTAKRPGDYLDMIGEHNGNVRAAVCYLLMAAEAGRVLRAASRHFTKSQMLEYQAAHRDELGNAMSRIPAKAAKDVGGLTFACFCFIMIARGSGVDAAEEFMRPLVTGADLTEGNPVLTARNKLFRMKGASADQKWEVVGHGWNAHRKGVTRTAIRVNKRMPQLLS